MLLSGLLCVVGYAQNNKSQAYYNTHETEILPDAQTAFRNANYERAVELCRWHYIIVGDSRADALGEKSRQCAILVDEMNTLASSGKMEQAKEKAKAILRFNPDDRKAKEFMAAPQDSSRASSSANQSVFKGVVVNETGDPLIGVSVYPKDDDQHVTASGLDGTFSLGGIHPGDVVVFLYIGYITREIAWDGSALMQVVLKEDRAISSNPGSPAVDETNHDWVDLGLPSGTLWATCNMGASRPDQKGDRFAWGDMGWYDESIYEVNLDNYKWCNGSYGALTKYNYKGNMGIVDNKRELDPEDDAATMLWGKEWSIPTETQLKELLSKCKWIVKTFPDGYEIVGRNGNSIFLPVTDFHQGSYWSKTLSRKYPDSACTLELDVWFDEHGIGSCGRARGLYIRPVRKQR